MLDSDKHAIFAQYQAYNQVVCFSNRAEAIFQEVPTIGGGSVSTNDGMREVQGIENSFKAQWKNINTLFNISWQLPKDDNLVSDSLNIPRFKANLLLDYIFDNQVAVEFYHPQVRSRSPLQYKQNGRSFSMGFTMDY